VSSAAGATTTSGIARGATGQAASADAGFAPAAGAGRYAALFTRTAGPITVRARLEPGEVPL